MTAPRVPEDASLAGPDRNGSDPAPLIAVENVSMSYGLGRSAVAALRGVSLRIESGEFLALSGPSGSGKTTLLNLIGGLERPTEGRVVVGGTDLARMTDRALARFRLDTVGFIFQNFNLISVLTALENVEYPLTLKGLPKEERRSRALDALRRVGIESQAGQKPLEMSGGQRQRVAVARAMVTRPALVLADEPTANLDHENGERVLDLMQRLNAETGATFVFSTHDPRIRARATRIVPLSDGRIESETPR